MSTIARAGLVGAGRIAEAHVHAIRAAGVELRGIVASDPARSRAAAERLGAVRAHDSVAALAADPDIDVVHVTSPTGMHAEHVAAVIAAGKHVVCEKPLAATASEAQQLATAAHDAGVVGTVAFTYRFHPVVLEARARVRDGDLGRLISVRGRYLQDWLLAAGPDEWRLDSTRNGPSRAWADIGSHLVDLIEFVTGDPVSSVAALSAKVVESASTSSTSADDAVAAAISTERGGIGSLLVSQVAPGHANSLAVELSGDLGAIGIDLERTESLWIGSDGAGAAVSGEDLRRGHQQAGFTPVGGMADLLAGFSAFVRSSYEVMSGTPSDVVATLEDGFRAIQVCDAVLRSDAERRWVDVSAR